MATMDTTKALLQAAESLKVPPDLILTPIFFRFGTKPRYERMKSAEKNRSLDSHQ